jgi:hypothetical protein
MKQQLTLTFFLVIIYCSTYGQGFEKLKLTDTDVPDKYKSAKKILYKSVQAINFYNDTDLYSFIGEIKSKDSQSFKSKDDEGTIFYFEFEQEFKGQGFVEGLLWGDKKASKEHPEEIFIKDNILIIWSFSENSDLKKISKDKITAVLQ